MPPSLLVLVELLPLLSPQLVLEIQPPASDSARLKRTLGELPP
jgi:hypothetical protein